MNKLHLTCHDCSKGPLGSDPWMKMSVLVMSRLTQMRREKVLKNIFLTLGQEAQLLLPQFQRRRTDTRHVEGLGGVPGEGQSAHLVSGFVGSAPTSVSSVCKPTASMKHLLNSVRHARAQSFTSGDQLSGP